MILIQYDRKYRKKNLCQKKSLKKTPYFEMLKIRIKNNYYKNKKGAI